MSEPVTVLTVTAVQHDATEQLEFQVKYNINSEYVYAMCAAVLQSAAHAVKQNDDDFCDRVFEQYRHLKSMSKKVIKPNVN